jgi:hypothetical protein
MSFRRKVASTTFSGFKGITGCEKLRAQVNALTKHLVPVERIGVPTNATELSEARLASGHRIPRNTSGVATRESIPKSHIQNDVLHEYTPVVHETQIEKGRVTGSRQVAGPSYLKFDLTKRGHYEGYEEL